MSGRVPALIAGVLVAVFAALPASASAASGDAEELLAEYAPVVVLREQPAECGPGEPYRPVPVDVVLDRADVALRDADGREVVRAPSAEDLQGRPDGDYLDFPGDPLDPACDYERWFDRIGAETRAAVYGRVAADPAHPGMTVVQYWFWWVFNDWNDRHEGDWEMVQLTFDAPNATAALTVPPSTVAFAQHEGAQVAEWDDPQVHREGSHVAVYPGEGSHAAYFTQSQWFGKSSTAGFGCDNTSIGGGIGAELLRPRVLSLDDADPPAWLSFEGRWGEKELSFNNGPTGPNMKTQWQHPVSWTVQEGRPDAVALPPLPGAAEGAFCSMTAAGSSLLASAIDRPLWLLVLVVAAGGAGLLIWHSTRWGGSPPQADAERRAGQILVGPWHLIRRQPLPLLGLALGLAAVLTLVGWVQQQAVQAGGQDDVTMVGALQVSWVGIVTVVCVSVGAWVLTAIAAAGAGGVTAGTGAAAGARAWRVYLATYLVIAASAAVVVLLPVSLILAARWAAAPGAAATEGLGVRASWRRSTALTHGRRWRSLGITLGLFALVCLPGPAIGAFLLLLTPLPFAVVNLVTVVLLSLGVALGGVGLVLHFLDLRRRTPGPGSDSLPE